MKPTYSTTVIEHGEKRISIGIIALAVIFMAPHGTAAILALNLGSASNFAVLAGSGITIAGAVNSTRITGDIGSFPTPTITGLENLVLNGVNHGGDGVTQAAKPALAAAYADAVSRPYDTTYADGIVLSGTLVSGVHSGVGSVGISGILTLDAQGDPDAVWIIKAGTTLISASSSQVNLIGGAKAENVFWQVGSSATLGTNSKFAGDILALQSITLTTGASVDGRILALNGAVTMDNNMVLIPEAGSALLLCSGLAWSLTIRKRADPTLIR